MFHKYKKIYFVRNRPKKGEDMNEKIGFRMLRFVRKCVEYVIKDTVNQTH